MEFSLISMSTVTSLQRRRKGMFLCAAETRTKNASQPYRKTVTLLSPFAMLPYILVTLETFSNISDMLSKL